MQTCPACQRQTFAQNLCQACGFRVVQAQPEAPAPAPEPISLDPSFLSPVEPTAAEAPDSGTFNYSVCPSCQQPQNNAQSIFCDHCGYRIKVRMRKNTAADGEDWRCRDCGTQNGAEKTRCSNCGVRFARD